MLNPGEVKTVLEAALLANSQPLTLADLRRMFDEDIGVDTLRRLLDELREDWKDRGVELVNLASGWRFQTRLHFQRYLERINHEKPARYSRAVLETLAIIAYRQPVTRGDIEDIRGVLVSPHIIKSLEDRGWIDVVGHRDAPGRPAIFATTKAFLDDLGLRSLQELPPLEEIARTIDVSERESQAGPNEDGFGSENAEAEREFNPPDGGVDVDIDAAQTTEPQAWPEFASEASGAGEGDPSVAHHTGGDAASEPQRGVDGLPGPQSGDSSASGEH